MDVKIWDARGNWNSRYLNVFFGKGEQIIEKLRNYYQRKVKEEKEKMEIKITNILNFARSISASLTYLNIFRIFIYFKTTAMFTKFSQKY